MLTKNTKKSKKGFTLTEVLVVVLIIGVISAIAYPVYTKSINKSRAVEAINLLEMVRNKQIANYARKGEYLPNFSKIGQLTGNPDAEVKSAGDAILTIGGKYELAINNETNCMSAAYVPGKGKAATFTFSSSYEEAGLGCDGDICKTFGNIVGSSSSVCNCGDKACNGANFVLNPKTCSCDCPLACNEGGACYNKTAARLETRNCGVKNSGTQTRKCPASCSSTCSESWSSCTGQTCEGEGSAPCGEGFDGTKTRTCTNGTWSGWNESGCIKKLIECEGEATADCANCGTKTRVCDKNTGTWGAWSKCSGAKDETLACDSGYTGNKTRTCSDDVWGEWETTACEPELLCKIGTVQKQTCAENPDKYQTRTFQSNGTWTEWSGDCSLPIVQVCSAGATKTCGTCGKATCSSNGSAWGSCVETPKPSDVVTACGNCGKKTDTWSCNTSTAQWNAVSGACTGQGECAPGTKKLVMCGTNTGYNPTGKESFIYREVTCTSQCKVPYVAPCNSCTEHPNCGKDFGNGLTGQCYCLAEMERPLEPVDFEEDVFVPETGIVDLNDGSLSLNDKLVTEEQSVLSIK